VCLVLVFRLGGIWNTHTSYTARLQYVRGLLERARQYPGKKWVAGYDQADRKTLLMYWGLPFETLQISALESPGSACVLAIAENPDSLAGRLSPDSMVSFLMIPPRAFRDLPERYYRMTDSASYRVIYLQ
jgi:hypothetical protein